MRAVGLGMQNKVSGACVRVVLMSSGVDGVALSLSKILTPSGLGFRVGPKR